MCFYSNMFGIKVFLSNTMKLSKKKASILKHMFYMSYLHDSLLDECAFHLLYNMENIAEVLDPLKRQHAAILMGSFIVLSHSLRVIFFLLSLNFNTTLQANILQSKHTTNQCLKMSNMSSTVRQIYQWADLLLLSKSPFTRWISERNA